MRERGRGDLGLVIFLVIPEEEESLVLDLRISGISASLWHERDDGC